MLRGSKLNGIIQSQFNVINIRSAAKQYPCYISGKRKCLGESLARMELFLFISLLVQRFKFESAPGEKLTVDSVDGLFGIVHAPKPYSIVAVPRR